MKAPVPLISVTQAEMLRAASTILRDLYDEGYIDYQPSLEEMAAGLDAMLATYAGCVKELEGKT